MNWLENLPAKCESINPEIKKRGIYQTAVYKSKTNLSGSFSAPEHQNEDISEENILWNKARIIFNTSNLKGVNEQINIKIGNSGYHFKSKYQEQNRLSPNEQALYLMESEVLKESDFPTFQILLH